MESLCLYSTSVDVSITELRANLATWLAHAQQGVEITVTDRGVPVARIMPVGSSALVKDLTDRGVLGLPAPGPRRRATGRRRVAMVGTIDDVPRNEWR